MIRQGNRRGRDVRFKPSFRDCDNMIKVLSEILQELVIVGREGLRVNMTGD